MDFSEALEAVKYDKLKIAREYWHDKGRYIVLSPGFSLPGERVFSQHIREEIGSGIGTFKPYLMKRTSEGEFVPWTPSQTDLLTDDWVIV